MALAVWFWIGMFIWLCLGVYANWPNRFLVGGNVLLFVLMVLLGWATFGAPVK